MRPRVAVAFALAIALLLGVLAVAVVAQLDQAPVFSVATLTVELRHNPERWEGRTLLVRGMLLPALDPSCTAAGAPCFRLLLYDTSVPKAPAASSRVSELSPGQPGTGRDAALAVVAGPADPMRARLRRIPLLGDLVPRAQVVDMSHSRDYRIQLERDPNSPSVCPPLACFQGVLLDAASGAP